MAHAGGELSGKSLFGSNGDCPPLGESRSSARAALADPAVIEIQLTGIIGDEGSDIVLLVRHTL